jgi:crotonobetainyl-CoA:carnitine CoA-transferase CaiB-like acyl-CoA transferase
LDPNLKTLAGRRASHDAIDAELDLWAAKRDLDGTVDELVAKGVPAATLYDGRLGSDHPQMKARGFFEDVEHPAAGRHPIPAQPFHFSGREQWIRRAAPTLGEHNHEILSAELGLSDSEIAALEAEEIIGTRPKGL